MKKFFGLKRVFFIALIILVVMLSVGCSKKDVEKNVTDFLASDYVSVANYLSKNVKTFAKKYNESEETKGEFKASYVENKFEITIDNVFDKKTGMFLDFDGDNGYAIIADNYELVDLEIKGASPYYGIQSNEFYYSTVSGYLYSKDGQYVNVDESQNANFQLDDDLFSQQYKGQDNDESGVGSIYDTNEYVKDRYGEGWTIVVNKSIPMQEGHYTKQYNLSVYECYHIDSYDKKTNSWSAYSEGNCWMVCSYNVLQFLADAKGEYKKVVDGMKTSEFSTTMPSFATLESYDPKISEPNIYSKYYDCDDNYIGGVIMTNGVKHAKRSVKTNITFPKLYVDVREYVDKEVGRTNVGSIYRSVKIVNDIGKQYGYDFNAFGSILPMYMSSGIIAVDNGLPFIFCTTGLANTSYEWHNMAGCGYKIYRKNTSIWFTDMSEEIYFYELCDGHAYSHRYLDLSAYTGIFGIGLLNEYNKKTNVNGIKY